MSDPSSPTGYAAAVAAAATNGNGDDPTNNKLLDKAKDIRNTMPQWDAFVHVTSRETLSLVASFAGNPAERTKMLAANNVEAVAALLALFDKLSHLPTVQFVATLIDDILEEDASRAQLVINAGAVLGQPSVDVFIKKLSRNSDAYVGLVSANIVARLVRGGADMEDKSLLAYYDWLHGELRSDDKNRMLPALSCLARTFRRPRFRVEFCKAHDCFESLRRLVQAEAPVQQQYQAILCCWILAFSGEAIEAMRDAASQLVVQVSAVLSAAKKEKVVRVCLAFLRNVVENATNQTLAREMSIYMIGQRLLPLIESISQHNTFNDEELKDDAKALEERLQETADHMSTFDEYAAELRSGKLAWTPVHKSERFWRENADKLNDKKHEMLKLLLSILQKSDDPTVIEVALHDCGQYVAHYPYGRKALEELGHKSKIMELMTHENAAIRYHALIAVQKIMTDNWQYLGNKVKQEAQEKSA